MILTGIGVGFMLPTLTGAGASELPPARFATGVAVITMGRQVGAAIGIAILVAVLDDRTAAGFHDAWLISAGAAAATGALLAALGPRPRTTPTPIPAPA
jgi:hypothetical protein